MPGDLLLKAQVQLPNYRAYLYTPIATFELDYVLELVAYGLSVQRRNTVEDRVLNQAAG